MATACHKRPLRPILLFCALFLTILQQRFHYADSSLTSSFQNVSPKFLKRKIQVNETAISNTPSTVDIDAEHDEDHAHEESHNENADATEVHHDEDEVAHDENVNATKVHHDEDHEQKDDEDHSVVIEDDHEHEGEDEHEDHSAEEHGHDEEDDNDHAEHDHDEHKYDEHEHDHEDEFSKTSVTAGLEGVTKPWSSVFWYTVLVNLTTLVGVITLTPIPLKKTNKDFSCKEETTRWVLDVAVPAFAAGALLTTACLLILPEALNLIQRGVKAKLSDDRHLAEDDHSGDGHDDHAGEEVEQQSIVKFGLSLLFGFFIPMFLGAMASLVKECISGKAEKEKDPETLEETDEVITNVETVRLEPTEKSVDYKLVVSVLVGDGFHNFADGIFIGVGFMLCTRSVAIAILVTTIYHELAQELADFFLLTQHAGLSTFSALVLNFISGLCVTLGGLLVLGIQFTWDEVGVILCLSGGVYFYIAAVECIPRIEQNVKSFKDRILSLIFVAVGAVPIGLVLLNHSHSN